MMKCQMYFDRNLDTLKAIIGCAEKAAKIRKTEEKAKTNLLTKQKFSFDSNGKASQLRKPVMPPNVKSLSWREILRVVLLRLQETGCLPGNSSDSWKDIKCRESKY